MRATAKRGRVRTVRRVTDQSFDDDDTLDGAEIIELQARDAAPQRTILAQLAEHPATQMAAPIVGAVGGALAATVAIERFGVRREVATLGGALLAFTAAQNTSGLAKAVFGGAGMAGVSLCVVELLRARRPETIFGNQPAPIVEHRQAAPAPDAITRDDLAAALADMHARNAAANVERDTAQLEQVRQMKELIDELVGQLRSAKREIESLRVDAAVYQEERNATTSALAESTARAAELEYMLANDPPMVESESDQTAAEEAGANHSPVDVEPQPLNETEAQDVRDAVGAADFVVSPEVVAHFQVISSLLDEKDRHKLSTLIATMPKDVVNHAEAHLATLSPADAVTYLRTVIFPSVEASA